MITFCFLLIEVTTIVAAMTLYSVIHNVSPRQVFVFLCAWPWMIFEKDKGL